MPIRIEKRARFVLSTIFLTVLLLISTFFYYDAAIYMLPLLIGATYLATFFALYEDIEKIEWLMLFLMPIAITISWYLFYYLFPGRWLTRLPFIVSYAVSIYAVLLSSNIFNVGVEKNLQLYRAGFSVNYFFQTVVFFLLSSVIASFRWGFMANSIVFSIITALLSLQLYWSIRLDLHIRKEVRFYTGLTTLLLGQGACILSFLPLPTSMYALAMAVLYYCVSGLTYHSIDERLFGHTVREYVSILIIIFFLLFLSLNW